MAEDRDTINIPRVSQKEVGLVIEEFKGGSKARDMMGLALNYLKYCREQIIY